MNSKCLILQSLMLLLVVPCTAHNSQAQFTQVPSSVLYVSAGKVARFMWDYTVDDRTINFQDMSPKWFFYDVNNTASLIGHESVFEQRKWFINRMTCPKRLLNPTRVSKEANAILVIKNVTPSDSGVYGCSLMLTTQRPITSKVLLVVTSPPKFTTRRNSSNITEGGNLDINCSAIGDPTPNITLLVLRSVTKEIKSRGLGSAILRIQNITRNLNGQYECQATNNPNEPPVTMRININVMFKPRIDSANYSITSTTFRERNIKLNCSASGQPIPLIKWFDPRGHQIMSRIKSLTSSVIVIETIDDADYGRYKCQAKNRVGEDVHYINITHDLMYPQNVKVLPDSPNVIVSDINASSIAIQWSTTPVKSGKSFVLDFKVHISTIPIREVITRYNYLVITELKENTKYVVKVYARNNVGYGNATTLVITTKKQASKQFEKPRRAKDGKVKGIMTLLAVAIGVSLLIVTVAVVLIIIIYKRIKRKEGDKNYVRDNNNNCESDTGMYAPVNPENDEGKGLPVYAQVDVSRKRKNRMLNEVPIYAQVDKSKKKRPGQMIYAELEELKLREEISNGILPLPYSATEYAELQGIQDQRKTDPIYETLPTASQ